MIVIFVDFIFIDSPINDEEHNVIILARKCREESKRDCSQFFIAHIVTFGVVDTTFALV